VVRLILKQRLTLGIMLLCVALLFMWASNRLRQEPLQLFLFGDPIDMPETQAVDVMGRGDVIFTPPAEISQPRERRTFTPLSTEQIQNLQDFSYITNRIFLVDPETILLPTDIDVHSFLEADLTIDTSVQGPTVLIFHTHSTEMFTDSDTTDAFSGILGTGRYLPQVLSEHHGLEVLHHTGRFDIVDGTPRIQGSYERMEPVIRRILEENPSIQVVIDLHRDGVGANAPAFTRYVDDLPTAQLMFFNGLSRQNLGGQAVDITRLPNPYQQENLNFSFRLQLAANQMYPGLARRVYLRQFRYSLHMAPLSTLVEVGNQHNTQREAKNAMYPLADIIAAVVIP